MSLENGNKAPAFDLPTDGGETLSLKSLKGKTVVLYFYPKDLILFALFPIPQIAL